MTETMDRLRIQVFSVGEGDCIVLHLPDGAVGLVDSCVPPWLNRSPAFDALRACKSRLAFVCLTHPHLDHYGGMLDIIEAESLRPEEFWHPFNSNLYEIVKSKSFVPRHRSAPAFSRVYAYETRAEEFPRVMQCVRKLRAGKERLVIEGRIMRQVKGSYEIVALAPSDKAFKLYTNRIQKAWEEGVTVDGRYENRVSAVLLIRFGEARILLGADAYRANWREIAQNGFFRPEDDRAHCYKAAHHGSKYGYYRKMFPVLLHPNCDIIVSAGGSRLASREFVEDACDGHVLWCTGKGPRCIQSRGTGDFRHLDGLSREEIGEKCFHDVEVLVEQTGAVEIVTRANPETGSLWCRH